MNIKSLNHRLETIEAKIQPVRMAREGIKKIRKIIYEKNAEGKVHILQEIIVEPNQQIVIKEVDYWEKLIYQ